MKIPFFSRDRRAETIGTLYGAIVAQARLPDVYRSFGIPDTLEARFEVLVLHLALVLDRMFADAAGRDVGQGVFDLFCQDMDDHMREMGVGDLTVPKKMRRLADAFYGRQEAYRSALGNEQALMEALSRNVYAQENAPGARALARYVGEAAALLSRQDVAGIVAGRVAWPGIAAISDASTES